MTQICWKRTVILNPISFLINTNSQCAAVTSCRLSDVLTIHNGFCYQNNPAEQPLY